MDFFSIWKKIVFCFVIPLLLEISVFNIRYWNSRGNTEILVPLEYGSYMGESHITQDGAVLLEDPDGNNVIQFDFSSLQDVRLKNISLIADCVDGDEEWLDYNGEKYASLSSNMSELTLVLTEGEENRLLPVRQIGMTPGMPSVISFPIGSSPQMITMKISGLKGNTVRLSRICLNVKIPMEFRFDRWLVLLCALSVAVLWRPSGWIWKKRLLQQDAGCESQVLLGLAIVFVVFAVFVYMLLQKNQIYMQGEGGFSPYRELAHAFKEGRTYITEQPEQELLELKDPFDPLERLEKGVHFKLDYALYNGHYYVYFGVVPCLLFYLPVYLLTGMDMNSWFVDYLLIIFIMCTLAALLKELALRYYPEISLGSYLLLLGVCGAVLTLSAVVSDSTAYYVPMLSAVLFYLLGVLCYLLALRNEKEEKRKQRFLSLGSLCMALIAGCRPQLIFGIIAVFPLIRRLLIVEKEDRKYPEWKSIIFWVSPFLPVAIGLMIYNAVRFGSPFDFGASYNLTFAYTHQLKFHPEAVGAGIYYYLFRLPHFSSQAPYLIMTQLNWSNPGLLANHVSTGGILFLYPVLWIGLCLLLPQKAKRDDRSRELLLMGRLWLGVAVGMTAFTGVMGGLMDRYRMDCSGFAALAFVAAYLSMGRKERQNTEKKAYGEPMKSNTGKKEKLWKYGVGILAGYSILISCLLYFQEGVWWIYTANPEWYTTLREMIEFWR